MLRQNIKDVYYLGARYLSLPTLWFAKARYRLRGPARPEGHYLHLGCGFKYIDGLINCDGNVFRKIDLWLDFRNGLPFPDKSCKFVYSSHTLEHLFPEEAVAVLREIRRVLKDDGEARIAVPSFDYALEVAWGEHLEDWPRAFADSRAQAINYLFCDGQHKYAYNYEILASFAREAGFTRVEHYSDANGVRPRSYGAVTVGDEPKGSLVVELSLAAVPQPGSPVAAPDSAAAPAAQGEAVSREQTASMTRP